MKRTFNQMIMLNAAASVNYSRMQKRTKGDKPETQSATKDPQWNGKRLDEMNSEEWLAYYTQGV